VPDEGLDTGLPETKSCLVFLGSSSYPHDRKLDVTSVGASAIALKGYFQKTMHVAREDLLDLFGSGKNASDHLKAIRLHLASFVTRTEGYQRNVFVIYAGHGLVQGGSFYLALAATDSDDEPNSSLSIAALAAVIKARAAFARRFVILDCCYAGEALAEFLSPDAFAHSTNQLFEHEDAPVKHKDLKRGTTVLCAVDKDTAAKAPKDLPLTMFSTAFMHAVTKGHPNLPEMMTFRDVYELVGDRLPEDLQPALVSPDQTRGDLAHMLRLFPNPAARREPSPPLRPYKQPALHLTEHEPGPSFPPNMPQEPPPRRPWLSIGVPVLMLGLVTGTLAFAFLSPVDPNKLPPDVTASAAPAAQAASTPAEVSAAASDAARDAAAAAASATALTASSPEAAASASGPAAASQ